MRIRFITCTPMNVFKGSGTFVGIITLANAVRALGVAVDLVIPQFNVPIYTLQRFLFNQSLRLQPRGHYDVTVGFDLDGYTVAGAGHEVHIASIKGVIADEMRFESGLTRATMRLQANWERLHVHRAASVITTSRYASRRIQELYGLPYAPAVIPEPIDLALWQKLLKQNPDRRDSDKFVVLSVCRFYRRKRLNILLSAAERLRAAIPGLNVRIVGGGPEIHHLKSICGEKGLQDIVTWREDISQSELSREYNRCDVFCLPSVQEGFGLVFLEAMAHGKAIVAARSGAAPEVARHAVLVEPDSAAGVAEAIELLYRSPALRAELGMAGHQFVKQFDAPLVAKLFIAQIETKAESTVASAKSPEKATSSTAQRTGSTNRAPTHLESSNR
jgi:glycosyltransferase involved in cell wall biosynthesis